MEGITLRSGFRGLLDQDPPLSELTLGQWWFNTTENQFKYYDGTAVKPFRGMSLKLHATGTVTADGTEQTLTEIIGLVKLSGCVDLSNMTTGDRVLIREYMKARPDGAYRKHEEALYRGVQDPPLILIPQKVVNYAAKVTLQQTGTFKSFDYTFAREE